MPRISREPALVVALMATLLALFHLTTTAVSANGGLGYDGVFYARMVETLRTGSPSDGFAPYAFRLLPPAIVAWSGLEVRLGFYVLNVASVMASALVLLAFLRDAKVPQTARIVATLWWAVLPFTLRWVVLYPVLVDGVGLFFLSLVLWSAYRRSLSVFALSLALGVLTRENLVLLAPLAMLRERTASGSIRAAASVLPAVLVLAAIHLWPPIPPDPAAMSTPAYIGLNARMLLENIDALPLRLAASPLLALGALSAVVIARPRACWQVLSAEPGWTYFVIATITAAALGGGTTTGTSQRSHRSRSWRPRASCRRSHASARPWGCWCSCTCSHRA